MVSFRIAYIDDEPDLCELFAEIYGSDEVAVRTYSRGEDAIRDTPLHPPDLLIIDYRLLQMTGDQLASRLDPAIPKVLITGDISVQVDYPFEMIVQKPLQRAAGEEIIGMFRKRLGSASK
jgi:CheY-like chemotaxis protein